MDPTKNLSKLIRTLIEVINHEIWCARCKCNYEDIKPNLRRSLASIRTNMKFILKTHYKHHLNKQSLNIFQDKFCINNAICFLDYHNQLNLKLPPWKHIIHTFLNFSSQFFWHISNQSSNQSTTQFRINSRRVPGTDGDPELRFYDKPRR